MWRMLLFPVLQIGLKIGWSGFIQLFLTHSAIPELQIQMWIWPIRIHLLLGSYPDPKTPLKRAAIEIWFQKYYVMYQSYN